MNSITSQKVPLSEKISISLGDAGMNMVWNVVSAFLIFFYTDVFGISAAAVGTLFLVSRIWDAVNDPMMGAIADRTNTRWGKFRPFIVFSAIPFAILAILMFTTPNLGMTGKLIWAYITFNLFILTFTSLGVPYNALIAVSTQDAKERITINSMRGLFYGLVVLITSIATLPLVNLLGRGVATRGYQLTMSLYAFIAVVCFMLTFFKSKERVKPIVEQRGSLKKDIKNLGKNKPWIILSISILIATILIVSRMAVVMYYFTYNVGNQDLAGPFLMTTGLAIIIAMIFVKFIVQKIGKKSTFIMSMLIFSAGSVAFFFINPQNIALLFIVNAVLSLSIGMTIPLGLTMTAETVDYSEWKHGVRATGIITSSITLSQKFGASLGGAAVGWLLSYFGYVAGVEQNMRTLFGIKFMMALFPAILSLIAAILIVFYPINEKLFDKIRSDLDKRKLVSKEI